MFFIFYIHIKMISHIKSKYLTLTVGDNSDNLEFVRLGGNGGVLPHEHSPFKVVERDKIGKGLV